MAWVTTLGPDIGQVDYRLRESAGCGADVEADAQTDYRLDDSQAALTWIGGGLAEFGIDPEAAFGQGDKDAARLIMSGQDPTNKEQLVDPQRRVDPRAKLAAAPLVDAITTAAAQRDMSPQQLLAARPAMAKRFGRLERGLAKDEHHRAPVRDLAKVARAADILLDDVYDAPQLSQAREHAADTVRTGNRGYDLTLDTAKSFSVLVALADEDHAARLRATYAEAVSDTIAALETWAAYGMRGHHGDGGAAARVDSTGLLGWSMTHHTARPVGQAAPDPHLHAHVTIANMVKGVDGRWSTVGAGGRDIMRHAHACDAFLKARLRQLTAERDGVSWHRDPHTGAWEITGIDAGLRDVFSKRGNQAAEALTQAGIDTDEASSSQKKLAGRQTAEGKQPHRTVTDLRADWRAQAEAAGYDVDRVIAQAAPGPTVTPSAIGFSPNPESIAQDVFDPESGLTANAKTFTRADLLARVADAAGTGLDDQTQLEALTDEVLAVEGYSVALGKTAGGPHLSNAQRYTTADIVEAEEAILTAARDRADGGYAAVDADTAARAIDEFEDRVGFALSREQRDVVERLTTTSHGIDAVIGVAGSGKTTVMDAVKLGLESGGYRVAGASTAAVAAHHLQAETGIESTTMAVWNTRIAHGYDLGDIDVLIMDEAAMNDDRDMAALTQAAGASGTKLIGIGDHQQLRSPGVGSTFSDVHARLDGLTLAENRRQRHETHRRALQGWRDGGRRAALDALAEADCIHTEDALVDTHAAMIGDWDSHRVPGGDPHEAIRSHLMLAGTNADVDALNDAAQALRLEAGELDPEAGRDYRQRDGQWLPLYPGDQVMLRINNRDKKRPGPNVLNGYRGILTDIDAHDGAVTVQWRDTGDDAEPVLRQQTLSRDYVERGGVQRGYAMTVHKAQGQTAQRTTADITGLEPTAAYAALTRHRDGLQVWLTRDVLEDDATRAALGEPENDEEKLRRAIDAYAHQLERPDPEELVIAELDGYDKLLAHRATEPEPESDVEPAPADGIDEDAAASAPARLPDWWQRAHGGLTPTELDRHLAQARRDAREGQAELDAWTARNDRRAADAMARRDAAARGDGDRARTLQRRYERLTESIAQAEAAEAARARARDTQSRIDALTQQQQHVRDQAATNPMKLRLHGTSRAALQQEDADLGVRLNAHVDERDQYFAAARDHTAEADAYARGVGHRDHTAAPQALADLERDWDTHRADAINADIDEVDAAARDATELEPAPDADAIDAAHRHAETLQAEAELRQARPAAMAEWEDRDRAAARAEAAEVLQRDTAEAPDLDPRVQTALDTERAETEAGVEHDLPDPEPEPSGDNDEPQPRRPGPEIEM